MINVLHNSSMPYTTHQWLAQLINTVNVSCNSSMSCSTHQHLESSPTPQDVNIFVLTSDEDVKHPAQRPTVSLTHQCPADPARCHPSNFRCRKLPLLLQRFSWVLPTVREASWSPLPCRALLFPCSRTPPCQGNTMQANFTLMFRNS